MRTRIQAMVLAALMLGVAAAATLPASAGTVDERFVSRLGDDTGNDCADVDDPCRTLTHALSVATDGETITLFGGGTIDGGLLLDKDDMTIQRAGDMVNLVFEAEAGAALTITGSGNTVQGIVFRDFVSVAEDPSGHTLVHILGDENVVRSSHLHPRGGCQATDTALLVQGTPGDPAVGNTVKQTSVDDACQGLVTRSQPGLGGAEATTFLDNDLRGNALAMVVGGVPGALVDDNLFDGNDIGLHLQGGPAGDALVTDNLFLENGVGLQADSTAKDDGLPVVHFNRFVDNDLAAENLGPAVLDATHNWWASPLGPTHDGNLLGDGQPVGGDVAYGHWCIEEGCLLMGLLHPIDPHPHHRVSPGA